MCLTAKKEKKVRPEKFWKGASGIILDSDILSFTLVNRSGTGEPQILAWNPAEVDSRNIPASDEVMFLNIFHNQQP